MQVFPDFAAFAETFAAGTSQIVWTRLIADLETPVSAYMKLAEGRANAFLLESVEGGSQLGRYSFIGLKPDLVWRSKGDTVEINRGARMSPDAFRKLDVAPLDGLRALIDECRITVPDDMPPMSAGLFGYLAYDMVRHMEALPNGNPDALGIPDAILLRPTVMAVFDNVTRVVTVVSPVWATQGVEGAESDAAAAYRAATERLADAVADFSRQTRARPALASPPVELPAEPASNTPKERFLDMVRTCVDYIHAGDAFQIVPSQRFHLPFPHPPFSLYRTLRRLNPSPFLFFLDFGGFHVVGSSPEILVRVRDGKVTIRPLAGTRKRGATPQEDRALAEELLSDPKERAEHLMLLDLGRNDVGRVAKIGSVKVTEQFVVEYYSHVMHISSNVEGELDTERFDALDALIAGFPAGTLSGAPKVRAMEIIDEVEVARRGLYAGCVGYFGANGTMDTCIALRTAVVKDDTIHIQAGGGVVADSEPEFEYEETVNKAKALIRAALEASALETQSAAGSNT